MNSEFGYPYLGTSLAYSDTFSSEFSICPLVEPSTKDCDDKKKLMKNNSNSNVIERWSCDICGEFFDDYDDAHNHEVLCRFKKQQRQMFAFERDDAEIPRTIHVESANSAKKNNKSLLPTSTSLSTPLGRMEKSDPLWKRTMPNLVSPSTPNSNKKAILQTMTDTTAATSTSQPYYHNHQQHHHSHPHPKDEIDYPTMMNMLMVDSEALNLRPSEEKREEVPVPSQKKKASPSTSSTKSKWVCDVCKMAKFNSFVEAYKHEKICAQLGGDLKEQQHRGRGVAASTPFEHHKEEILKHTIDGYGHAPTTPRGATRATTPTKQRQEYHKNFQEKQHQYQHNYQQKQEPKHHQQQQLYHDPHHRNTTSNNKGVINNGSVHGVKWLCGVCEVRCFDNYEKACRHEALCDGNNSRRHHLQQRDPFSSLPTLPSDYPHNL